MPSIKFCAFQQNFKNFIYTSVVYKWGAPGRSFKHSFWCLISSNGGKHTFAHIKCQVEGRDKEQQEQINTKMPSLLDIKFLFDPILLFM